MTYSKGLQMFVNSAGFMTDAYDLFSINVVKNIMQQVYPSDTGTADMSVVASASLASAIVGMLTFGKIADMKQCGRARTFVITLTLGIIGAFGSALISYDSAPGGIYVWLTLWRLVMGFGVGGEYPLSAVVSFETTGNVGLTFAMQGVGNILAAAIALGLLYTPLELEYVWRIALGMGGVFGCSVIYHRVRMKETKVFASDKQANGTGSGRDDVVAYIVDDSEAWKDVPLPWYHVMAKEWKTILGTSLSWFLFDILFYGNGLFTASLMQATGLANASTSREALINEALLTAIIALIGLPGYFCGAFVINRYISPKRLQILGFIMMAVFYMVLGFAYDSIVQYPALFVSLYGLSFFAANFGPNLATFVIPGTAYEDPRVRATCHGIAAAAGKLGAVVGAAALEPVLIETSVATVLIICGGISVLSVFVSMTPLVPSGMSPKPGALSNKDRLPGTNYGATAYRTVPSEF